MAPKLSGKIVRDILSDAVDRFQPEEVKLISDGGPENVNHNLEELLQEKNKVLKRMVAQRDIDFSNSMVEAVIKIIKNNYLRILNPSSEKQLREQTEFAVNDYSNKRLHSSLNECTPYEAFTGKTVPKSQLKQLLKEARAMRLEENRKNTCRKCEKLT